MMDAKKVVKQVLLERHMDYSDLAPKVGLKTQSLRNKLNRGNYSLTDFQKLLNELDCELQVITRDTKKVFQ